MKITNQNFERWRRERDAAVETLDLDTFREFYKKWAMLSTYERSLPDSDKIVEAAMYRHAASIPTLPAETRQKAVQWLNEHGCATDIG